MEKLVAGFFLGIIALSLFLLIIGESPSQVDKRLKQEAIDVGAAEWMLVGEPGPDAEFKFRWLPREENTDGL